MFRDKALVLLEIINHGITEWFWLEKPSRTSESTIPPALPRSPLTPVPKGHLSVSFRNLQGWGLTAEDHTVKFCRKTNWRKFTQFFGRNWAHLILWTTGHGQHHHRTAPCFVWEELSKWRFLFPLWGSAVPTQWQEVKIQKHGACLGSAHRKFLMGGEQFQLQLSGYRPIP